MRFTSYLFLLFNLIGLLYSFNSQAIEQSVEYSQVTVNGIKLYEIEKQLIEIRDSSKLDDSKKISQALTKLDEAKPFLTEPQFLTLFSNVENLLLEIPEDLDVKFIQLGFLSRLANSNLWPFSINREEFTERFIKIAESKNANQQFPASTKLFIRFVEIPYLLQAAKYDELDAQLKDSYTLVEGKALWDEFKSQGNLLSKTLLKGFVEDRNKKLKKTFISVLRATDLRSQIDRGNVMFIIEQGNLLAQDFKDVSEFVSAYPNFFGKESLGFLGVFLLADEYLGNDQHVIEKANFIIQKYPYDPKNLDQLKFKSDLYRKISTAYLHIGNKALADNARKEANNLLIESGYIDSHTYANEFTYLMDIGDYANAKFIVNALEKYYSNPSQNNFEVFKQFLGVMRTYNNKATEKGRIDNEDVISYFKSGASLIEDLYFKSLENGDHSLQNDMETYEALNNSYYRAGDIYHAAFYAKRYVILLQKLRSDIKSADYKFVNSFTEKHEEYLKRFANNFYEVGDVDAALQCLQIVKENQFYDYVKRSNVPDNFLSTLITNNEENDFSIRLDAVSREIKALQILALKKSNSSNEIALINKTLDKKRSELAQARLDLNKYIHQLAGNNKPSNKQSFLSTTNLKESEAALYIDILPGEVFSYLTLADKSVQRFTYKIDSLQVRTLILDINLSLSSNSPIPKDKLAKLSDILISQPINYISNKHIAKLKIRVGDFIGFIPTNILEFKSKYLGEIYVLETQGLGKLKTLNESNLTYMNAFGATQGSSEFSKLPAVKTEIASLMQLPASQEIISRKSYIDMDFTRLSLMSSFKDETSLVHIATHFKASGNLAGSAKLLLGDGSTITLQDINNELPSIKTNLVTLSACDTGSIIPSNKSNNSYEGLSNAFQIKGAKNVMSTLWSIADEATADFMEAYYWILFNSKISPSEALHYTQNIFRSGSLEVLPNQIKSKLDKTKLGFMKNVKSYKHPYFWSAFQISTIN